MNRILAPFEAVLLVVADGLEQAWGMARRLTGINALDARLSEHRARQYLDLAERCRAAGIPSAADSLVSAAAFARRQETK